MKQRLPDNCLPAPELLPKIVLPPSMQYPAQLNACRELLDQNMAAEYGRRPAIYFQGRTICFDELAGLVESFSASLLELGLVPGDRVLLRFWNQPEFIIAWLAVLRVGGIVVATMPLLRSRELRKVMADCHPAFAITQEDLWDELEPALSSCPTTQVIFRGGRHKAAVSWDELLSHPQRCPAHDTEAENIALLAYTSGSTGEPKGTIHTHGDVLGFR